MRNWFLIQVPAGIATFVLALALSAAPASAASITASPSSGADPGAVTITLNLDPGQAFDNYQLTIDLVDGGTGQDIYTVAVTGQGDCGTFGGWSCFGTQVQPTSGPGGIGRVSGGGFSLGGSVSTSSDLAEITLTPTGASGTLHLVLDVSSTAQLNFVDIAGSPFSGTIASFTAGAVDEAPLALMLGPLLFAAAFFRPRGERA
jgi:hypothetical protein